MTTPTTLPDKIAQFRALATEYRTVRGYGPEALICTWLARLALAIADLLASLLAASARAATPAAASPAPAASAAPRTAQPARRPATPGQRVQAAVPLPPAPCGPAASRVARPAPVPPPRAGQPSPERDRSSRNATQHLAPFTQRRSCGEKPVLVPAHKHALFVPMP